MAGSPNSKMEETLAFPSWLELPEPLAELILERLPLVDYIRFAAVCPKWRSIQGGHRLRHAPHPPPMEPHPLPWLIPCDPHLGTGFECYSPLEKKLHRLPFPATPTFPNTTFCMASSRGWLLMLDLDLADPTLPIYRSTYRSPFLFNPLTRSLIQLPMLSFIPEDHCFGALSSPPYDPDCTIILVNGGSVLLHDHHDCWTIRVEIEELIDSAVNCGGKFYCISRKRVLYVIDGVRSTPMLLPLTMDVSALDLRDGNRCQLVEFSRELLLVMELYGFHDRLEGFQVFMADLSGEKWVKKMDMLADHVLFLDPRCSFSLLASDVGCKKNCKYCVECHGWMVFDLDTMNWIHEETFSHEFLCGRWFLPTLG